MLSSTVSVIKLKQHQKPTRVMNGVDVISRLTANVDDHSYLIDTALMII